MELKEIAINKRKFPFLKYFSNNRLRIEEAAFTEIMDFPNGIRETRVILKRFEDVNTSIYYPSKVTHQQLLNTENFIGNKSSIIDFPEMSGLLLLPENLTPNVVRKDVEWRPQYLKMNSILFSFLKWSTYDEIRYGEPQLFDRTEYADDEDYNWEVTQYETGRLLTILPIQLDKFFLVDTNSIQSVAEEYGNAFNEYGRDINGNIVDYVWSFLIFFNSKEPIKVSEIDVEGNYVCVC